MTETYKESKFSIPLIILIIYILYEYGKPEVLGPFRPGIVLNGLLLILLLFKINKIKTVIRDTFIKLFAVLLFEMIILGIIALNNYWALQYFYGFLETFVFALSICVFIDNIDKLKVIAISYVVVLTLIGTSQTFEGSRNLLGGVGVLGDTNDLAMGMVAVIPISFYLGLEYHGIKRLLFLLAGTVQITAVGSAASRGGFLGLVVVILLCWLKSKNKILLSFLMAASAILFIMIMPDDFKAEILSLSQSAEGGTGKGRIELWKVAWRAFTANPIFGVGQGNLPLVLGDYGVYGPGSYWQRHLSGTAVHSVYMTCLAELGLVGTITWVFMNVNNLKKYKYIIARCKSGFCAGDQHNELTSLRYMMTGFAIAMIGFLVSGIFLSAFYYPHFWILSAFITSTYMIANKMEEGMN